MYYVADIETSALKGRASSVSGFADGAPSYPAAGGTASDEVKNAMANTGLQFMVVSPDHKWRFAVRVYALHGRDVARPLKQVCVQGGGHALRLGPRGTLR